MTAKQKFRMSLDLMMTILSLILMGGIYFFPWDGVHEILGVALLVLWAVHVWLNRGFYKALFRGKYNDFRVLQAVINVGILLCAVFLMISGIMLSNHVFAFLAIDFGLNFARTAHLVFSHWYFVFMSLHIGMHVGMIARQIVNRKSERSARALGIGGAAKPLRNEAEQWSGSGTPQSPTRRQAGNAQRIKKIFPKILLSIVCVYGVYAFFIRNIGKYLLFLQPFFFFDTERGYILFFVDYICIMTAIAAAGFLLCEASKKAGSRHAKFKKKIHDT